MLPNRLSCEIETGEAFFQKGDINKALHIFDDVIEKDPHNARALNNKGVVLNLLGNYSEAEKIFLHTIEKNMITRDVVFNLISNYVDSRNWGKVQEAIESYGQLLSEEDLISIQAKTENILNQQELLKESAIPIVPSCYWQGQQENLDRILKKTLFFIVGCPKSGTTWLQNTLNGHPDILCIGESNINMIRRELGHLRNKYNEDISKINNTYIQDGNDYSILSEDNLDFLFSSLINLLFSNIDNGSSAPCIGMKNPDHLANMVATARLFPGMKYLHIIRDGRDVAVSGWFHNLRTEKDTFQRMHTSFTDFANNIAITWKGKVLQARNFGRSNPHRYFELRYEDLHQNPKSTIENILRFLGVDSSERAVAMCQESGSFKKLSNGRDNGQEDRTSFFRKGIVGDWKNHFDQDGLVTFDLHAKDLLAELGYE